MEGGGRGRGYNAVAESTETTITRKVCGWWLGLTKSCFACLETNQEKQIHCFWIKDKNRISLFCGQMKEKKKERSSCCTYVPIHSLFWYRSWGLHQDYAITGQEEVGDSDIPQGKMRQGKICFIFVVRQTDRQTDRQTKRQTDRQTKRGKQEDRETHEGWFFKNFILLFYFVCGQTDHASTASWIAVPANTWITGILYWRKIVDTVILYCSGR